MIYSLVWGCSGEGRSPWPAKNFWTRVLRLVRNLGLNRFVPARSWRLLGQLCLFVGREAPNIGQAVQARAEMHVLEVASRKRQEEARQAKSRDEHAA